MNKTLKSQFTIKCTYRKASQFSLKIRYYMPMCGGVSNLLNILLNHDFAIVTKTQIWKYMLCMVSQCTYTTNLHQYLNLVQSYGLTSFHRLVAFGRPSWIAESWKPSDFIYCPCRELPSVCVTSLLVGYLWKELMDHHDDHMQSTYKQDSWTETALICIKSDIETVPNDAWRHCVVSFAGFKCCLWYGQTTPSW